MAEQPRSEGGDGGGRRWGVAEAWVVGIGAGLVVVALMGAAYSIGYNKGESDAEPAEQQAEEKGAPEGGEAEPPPQTAATGPGRDLFTQGCGSCHTLADAGTSGTVGPSLDTLEPEAGTVETAIRVGGAGTGAMPPDIYSGKQAEQVAEYVAAVAGGG
ncbi:MAG TPA: cytochrome c [Solirubrobacterales bacterium]